MYVFIKNQIKFVYFKYGFAWRLQIQRLLESYHVSCLRE